MNTPLRSPSREGDVLRVLAATHRVAAPSAADRERVTEALRARLGAVVLPEGLVPAASGAALTSRGPSPAASGGSSAARAGLGRGGWLGVVVGTGVVAGALGFVLGYGVAERERGATLDGPLVIDTPLAIDRPIAPAATPGLELAPVAASSGAEPTGAERSGARAPGLEGEHAPRTLASERAAPVRRRAPVERPGRAAQVERGRFPAPEGRGLSFTEVLERVQRANVELRRGQAALVLIQLAELDRGAGEVLREEREATRALALCAIGDTDGARRVAAPLLSGATRSIYAPRLDSSCAREGVDTVR